MTPAPKYHSDSRVMEAHGEVKKEPVVVAALKEGGRLVKRKRASSESEQGQKRSHGVNSTSRAPFKTKSAKENGAVNGKRKRLIVAAAEELDPEMDSEHVMNAAQALFELFGGAGASSQKESPDSKSCEAGASPAAAGGVKWAAKKSRSSRSKKTDDCACKLSSSSTTSATVTDIPEVLDSSTSYNHHLVASHHPVAVNLEDESEADADAKSTDMSPYGLDLDRGHRLLSQSSVESTLLDSRAESPSSPLRVLKPDAALIPKLEEELMLQFGFQKQAPVTKPSILRKPKVEENGTVQLDELKEVKITVKQVQRRKPRASNLKGPPLLLQGDVLDVPIASSAAVLKECIEENKFQVPVTLNLFEPVKLETGVKVEGRDLYQTGSSTQVRLRSALSEAEKEARRLRRVQANRESARQTIRRKQVLCEELARKAGELQAEKDNLALSLEAKSKELRNYQEINRHLKEQVIAQAASAEAPLSTTTKASVNMASSPVTATTGSIQGMPMLPYWWAFALAQSMAAATSQSAAATPPGGCEPGAAGAAALPPDFNTVFAATVAAFNSGAGLNPNMWMSMMGNMTNNPGMVPALDPKHQPSLAHSAPRPTEASSPKPDGAERPLARSAMPVNGHPYPSSSSVNAGMTNQMSQFKGKIPAGIPSSSNSRVKYQLTNNQAPSPLVRSASGMTSQVHVSGDGMTIASTTLSLGLGSHSGRSEQQQQQMRKPENLRFFPTIGNGVQGFLGPRLGVYQSEAAALATEARRRRRELKRTKSLQSQLQLEKKLASVKSL